MRNDSATERREVDDDARCEFSYATDSNRFGRLCHFDSVAIATHSSINHRLGGWDSATEEDA